MNTYDANRLRDRLASLEGAIGIAEREREADNEYWEEVATGQDTQEAEHSGYLDGLVAGLELAQKVIRDGADPVPHIAGLGDHS